ncbi:MAG TPA: helix-turn-helix transcriptional regulator [Bacteroidia bacterium]|nr:helix-turn-helix transcriptional regulator [Bacteroidia bacterium]
MNYIGYKIKKIRELKGLSQGYMAKQMNIEQPQYSRIEQSDDKISAKYLEAIAAIFEMKMDDIIHFDEKVIFNISNHNNHLEKGVVYQNGMEHEILLKQIQDKDKKNQDLMLENYKLKAKLKKKSALPLRNSK